MHTTRNIQPAKGVLVVRDIEIRTAAAAIGVHRWYLGDILNGRRPATSRVRMGLSEFLALPETELFTERVTTPRQRRGPHREVTPAP